MHDNENSFLHQWLCTYSCFATEAVVCYTAVFSVVTRRSSPLSGGALRDNTKNGCVADYSTRGKRYLKNTACAKGETDGPPGGGYSWEFLVGVCRPVPQILTRFQTKKCNFPHPFSD